MAEKLSNQIYLSRDSIREQISNEVKNYMELNKVDLTKSSFLSFIIDTVSTLTGNLLFYQLSTYREFFLTKAQLPESILNLSSFLGYNTKEATSASVNVLMSIPLTFDDASVQFTIPENFIFKSDEGIEFRTYYTTTIKVENNSTCNIVVANGNKRYTLPYDVDSGVSSFILPLRQFKETIQEYQIDSDTQEFQFVTLDVPITGELASIQVEIQDPGSSGYVTWTEFDSLFLMSSTDKGFVSRRTDSGRRLTFGNGLIGVQPTPGSTVQVTVQTTEGADGNVIAASIRSGQRIYVQTLSGSNQVVSYEVTNPSPAFGGIDEESLEEIRKNSIANISTLERLVTENDYKNINVVVDNSPIAQNSLPVLKRSDLQVNEIELFNGLVFGSGTGTDNLVPTRNAVVTLPISQTLLPRDTELTIGDFDYYTMFDINVDLHNTVGNYEYIMYEMEQIPALETNYSTTYDLYSDKLEVIKDGTQGIFRLYYKSSEVDADLATCTMKIVSSGSQKIMTNDATAGYFVYVFDPYTDLPLGEQKFLFTIVNASAQTVAQYSNTLTFRDDLSNFMRSNVVYDATSINIYDVPVIEKTYYDAINKRDFELQVFQTLITSMDLTDSKMLTDFTNIKFTNTYGTSTNMTLNKTTIADVIDIVQTVPSVSTLNNRYIYAPCTGNDPYQDYIIKCTDSTALTFSYEEPVSDSIVYISNKGAKYIYSERGWIPLPNYNIPLEIEVEVFRSQTYSGTVAALINSVRDAIYDAFSDKFGTNAQIYRSEITDVVQNVDGVSHCRLKKPETSVFFNFELKNLTQEELLAYGPEYVYFTTDSITVRVS